MINYKSLLLILLLLIISLSSPLAFNDIFISIVFIYSIFIFWFYKKKLDWIPIVIITLWFIINLLSYNYNNTSFEFYTFYGTLLKILLPYFALKDIGPNLFNKFSKLVYNLTIISFPIYLTRIIFPDLFEYLNPIFNPLTANIYHENGWYSFIFTYNRTNLRNSGFMWEPGAYAMVLNIAILQFYINNNYKLNYKLKFLLIALLTTFSTMGYLSIMVFLVLYVFSSRNYKVLMFILPLLFLFAKDIYQLDFISGKINNYVENIDRYYYREESGFFKVNRFSILLITLEEVFKYPLGYGIVPSKYAYQIYGDNIKGVGGLSDILRMWGPLGLFFIIRNIHFYYKLKTAKMKPSFLFLFTTIILFAFFSNPIAKSPLPYLFLYFPLVYKQKLGNPKFSRNHSL